MNRHNLPLAWHAATDISAIGWVMIAYSSNCLISQEWLASIVEGDSIINATLLYFHIHPPSLAKIRQRTSEEIGNTQTHTQTNVA